MKVAFTRVRADRHEPRRMDWNP